MGTMDVITLDDTMEHDASLYIIDDQPAPVIEEGPMPNQGKRKRRGSNRKKFLKKKNKSLDKDNLLQRANWILIGPSSNALKTPSEVTTSCSSIQNSISSSDVQSNGSVTNHEEEQNQPETIVIEDGDSDAETMDVIELSDDEVGVIGGELSKSVNKAQKQLTSFQQQGRRIMGAWPGFRKKSSPKSAKLSTKAKKSQVTGPRTLRPIVIDGSNVAFGHGTKNYFSSKGLEICSNYFISRGHTVKIFLPQFRRRHHATADTHILDKLEKEKILIFTPSRKVDGKSVVSYDDRYIVEYATKCGGVIVSRDNYQDLMSENHEWKETIHKRLLMYTWVDDMIMFPQDPLGRQGPTLDEFLSFPPDDTNNSNSKPSIYSR